MSFVYVIQLTLKSFICKIEKSGFNWTWIGGPVWVFTPCSGLISAVFLGKCWLYLRCLVASFLNMGYEKLSNSFFLTDGNGSTVSLSLWSEMMVWISDFGLIGKGKELRTQSTHGNTPLIQSLNAGNLILWNIALECKGFKKCLKWLSQ